MKKFVGAAITLGLAPTSLGIATPALAKSSSSSSDHGKCLRFNKTNGAVTGAVAGGVLGGVIGGDATGAVVGAAAGGLLGHELATNRKKNCKKKS